MRDAREVKKMIAEVLTEAGGDLTELEIPAARVEPESEELILTYYGGAVRQYKVTIERTY